jgi:uncharacterized protein (DUF952 family)
MIYHIVPELDLRAHLRGDSYAPASLEECGFVHCALESSVIAVANDFFSAASETLLLLQIDQERLTSAVRYEAPAPIAGEGRSHLATGTRFPHVYGPINTEAITGVGVLGVGPDGYRWLREFQTFNTFLGGGR